MLRPNEISVLSLSDKADKVVSNINDEFFADLEVPTVEERWVDATDGKKIHCWVIYPPNFDPEKEWPLITYCQGGPQAQIGQSFSYRWNFHLMAAQGYVVVAPNRRGLPGFGREWNDQISQDWGGQAMQDLLSATDEMVREPYVDSKRVAAVGASWRLQRLLANGKSRRSVLHHDRSLRRIQPRIDVWLDRRTVLYELGNGRSLLER